MWVVQLQLNFVRPTTSLKDRILGSVLSPWHTVLARWQEFQDGARRPEENRRFIELKVLVRQRLEDNQIAESVICGEVANTSTLIDALRFLLRNTSAPLL